MSMSVKDLKIVKIKMWKKTKTIKWHRLIGLFFKDFFTGSRYSVELEKDLSIKQQFLDVVIIEDREGKELTELPDGLDNLGKINLLSYKSHQETLDEWAIHELIGHYVNCRKQIGASNDNMPIKDYRLYAVSAHYPLELLKIIDFREIMEGIYEIKIGSLPIRIIVTSRVPDNLQNTIWNIFSGISAKVSYGASNYKWNIPDVSTIINQIYEKYKIEGVKMPYTFENFREDYVLTHLDRLSPDVVLERFSPDDRLQGLSPDVVLERFSPNDRLQGLSPDEIKAYLKKIS